jgi:protein arginine N-methyltransferase 1
VSDILETHRHYLGDAPRVRAFAAAIRRVVRPGDVVIDLGAGSGVLGLLACQAGAARVYAIDSTPALELARALATANGVADRYVFVREHSTRVRLPEPADVVVADQLGSFGYGGGVLEYFADARARLLKPGGRMVPSTLTFVVAPVESARGRERVAFWDGDVEGLTLKPVAALASNSAFALDLADDDRLAPATAALSVPCDECPAVIRLSASGVARRGGLLDGIGAWFEAELCDGISMTNAPGAPSRIDRLPMFFPLRTPVAVEAGDRIATSLTIRPRDDVEQWSVTVSGAAGVTKASASHSTFGGLVVGGADLARTHASATPVLSEWGRVRREVLGLCDGSRSRTSIELEIAGRYPALFHDPHVVSRFVADVLDASV